MTKNINPENIVTIKGYEYVLKKVTQLEKDGGEKLGKVPVPYFPDHRLDEYLEWINGLGEFELKKHRDDWFYGAGVSLQKRARTEAKGAGFSEEDYDRIWDSLDGETLNKFVGNRKGLTAHIKSVWDAEQAANPTTYHANYVWDKYAKLHEQLATVD